MRVVSSRSRYVIALLGFSALLAGCGNAYRSTVSTINPVPVPGQPEYLPVVISAAGTSVPGGSPTLLDTTGVATIFDASGDSTLVNAPVGIQPVSLALGPGGGQAYVLNLGAIMQSTYTGSISSFGVATTLPTGAVNTSTLSTGVFAAPTPALATPCATLAAGPTAPAVFANATLIYAAQTTAANLLPLSRNVSGNGVPSLLPVLPVADVITNFTGLTAGSRVFAIETSANEVQTIDTQPTTGTPYISSSITGPFSEPTFGVTSPNGHRTFILNCNGTVTAINSATSTPTVTGNITVLGTPIWGDYFNAGNLLVTANTNGTGAPGTASIINADETASSFGTVLGTATVGVNPSGVAVLQESAATSGSFAYFANDSDDDTQAVPLPDGSSAACNCKSVSVVDLTSYTTVTTIPLYLNNGSVGLSCPAAPNPAVPSATGYPMQIVATPAVTDQQVFVLCDQPSQDGNFYIFAIRTYAQTSTPGQTSPGNVVNALIPVLGIPQQMRMAPSR